MTRLTLTDALPGPVVVAGLSKAPVGRLMMKGRAMKTTMATRQRGFGATFSKIADADQYLVTADDDGVIRMYSRILIDTWADTAPETKRAIINRFNAHDDLVIALRLLETASRRFVNRWDTDRAYVQRMCDRARAALELAEGE